MTNNEQFEIIFHRRHFYSKTFAEYYYVPGPSLELRYQAEVGCFQNISLFSDCERANQSVVINIELGL